MKLKKCVVTTDFKNLSGFYAKKGATGHVTAMDRGQYTVLFDDKFLPLIKSNDVRGNSLTIPAINLKVGEREEVEV